MLQYTPDKFQWFLLTASGPIAFGLIIVGIILVLFMAYRSLVAKKDPRFLTVGLPAVGFIALSFIVSSLPSTGSMADGIAKDLTKTAQFNDVKLLHIETTSSSPFADGSVSFIGTAKDVDGDPRQFRYTQYETFGVYDMVGFDKPEVNLKDKSFDTTDEGLDILKGTDKPNAAGTESTKSPTATSSPVATKKPTS